jgi:hypothetical protein
LADNRNMTLAGRAVSQSVSQSDNRWVSVVCYCCEKLVVEAGLQFGNPEGGERPPFEAVTKQCPVKTVRD